MNSETKPSESNEIVVLAPHPDDETLGCGGSIRLHAKHGQRITAIFLTSGERGLQHLPREAAWRTRENEARKAAKILGISQVFFLRCSDWILDQEIPKAAKLLQPLLKQIRPGLIYLPHPLDAHPDHRATFPSLERALQGTGLRPRLRFYEIWSPLPEHNVVEDISSVMATKLLALRKHKSQLADYDYVRAACGLNQYRGALCAKCEYAEVFQEQERLGT